MPLIIKLNCNMIKKILLLLFIPIISFGQSIDVLEDKNGYKIFKLNSNKLNYENNLKMIAQGAVTRAKTRKAFVL